VRLGGRLVFVESDETWDRDARGVSVSPFEDPRSAGFVAMKKIAETDCAM